MEVAMVHLHVCPSPLALHTCCKSSEQACLAASRISSLSSSSSSRGRLHTSGPRARKNRVLSTHQHKAVHGPLKPADICDSLRHFQTLTQTVQLQCSLALLPPWARV